MSPDDKEGFENYTSDVEYVESGRDNDSDMVDSGVEWDPTYASDANQMELDQQHERKIVFTLEDGNAIQLME